MRSIKQIMTIPHRSVKVCLLIFACSICFVQSRSHGSRIVDDNCLICHTRAGDRLAEVVNLHQTSVHGQKRIGCDGCHGGDPSQTDKIKAHSGRFVGKPDANGALAMCGQCHQPQLAQFKTSRHFPAHRGIPRIVCLDCHGVHTIGAPPDSFSFMELCASCHGLEYLPALPQPFRDLLTLSDDLSDGLKKLLTRGKKPGDEVLEQRRELRRLTAEIVHPTDRAGGLTRIPQILTQGEKLKRQFKD